MALSKWKITILTTISLLLALTACQPAPVPEPTPTLTVVPPAPTLPAPNPTPTASRPTATAAPAGDSTRNQYQLDVKLNYASGVLTVIEQVDYANTTGVSLKSLPLVIPPAQQAGVFSLISVTKAQTQEAIPYGFEKITLMLNLTEPLDPDETLGLTLIYTLRIPEGSHLLGRTDRQLLLTDWFPFVPPYHPASGWLIESPGAVGEYLAYPLADYTVSLEVSPPVEGLVVAASAPRLADSANRWQYAAENVRNMTFALSPYYSEYTHAVGDLTVKAYVFPEHADLGQRAADLASEAWAIYESIYGDKPRQYLAVIEADLSDGMEYDGAFLLSEDYFDSADETPQNYYTLLIVHETAHQWFYAQVANDQAAEPWLDEAFATYSELLYLETAHPDLTDWWWNYRVAAYQPSGWVDDSIYDHSLFRPYVNAVYLRGAQFLEALRQRIGDPAFFAVLQDFGRPAEGDALRTAADFFAQVDAAAQEDLTDLYALYFRNSPP